MDERVWASQISDRIHQKETAVVKRNAHKIPYTTEAGVFDDWSDDDKVCWWTNGFWAGMLWQLYNVYHEVSYQTCAKEIEDKLDKNLMNYMGMDHDSGFKWLLTSGANYQINNDEKSKNRLMLAAGNLAGRINLKAGLIRAWNDPGNGDTAGWAIIDCMMNLPLLYNASALTKDPRFTQIAMCHADNAMKVFMREDGSVNHIVTFDPDTGEFIRSLGGQGMQEGSSWTRGQSWAVYGFTLSYHHTKKIEYLDTAIRSADYILSKIPVSNLIPVDYDQPESCDWEDDTAAAITACGLLLLSEELGKAEGKDNDKAKKYYDKAVDLLKTLADSRCNWDPDTDQLLERCSAAYNDDKHDFSIIYGDYFFTEAILRLCGKEIFLW
ncbi:MAG: glycoside hydrolase family 88 protein [Lachnospiraceae bacterium]|nr:glycoside hydrolase family 88 protein [Lachnospiraceae bacterium]